MSKKTYCILLNVEVETDQQPGRVEYYYSFAGWKHGIATEENAISFEGRSIEDPYSRWSTRQLQELGEVIRLAAHEMVKEDE
jgi:hypothetical protein